jgi:hypothetical protein
LRLETPGVRERPHGGAIRCRPILSGPVRAIEKEDWIERAHVLC